jgi:hypothetical protein
MKTRLKKLWTIKAFRVFAWNTFNGIITLISSLLLMQVNPTLVALAPIIMSGLNMFTKYINKKYFNDL